MVRLCLHVHVSIQACAHSHTLKKANKYPKRPFAVTSRAEEEEARLKDAMANVGESCEGDTRALQRLSAPVRLMEASVLRAKLTVVRQERKGRGRREDKGGGGVKFMVLGQPPCPTALDHWKD